MLISAKPLLQRITFVLAASILVALNTIAPCCSEEWQGWKKVDFQVNDRSAFLIVPHTPATNHPWIWRTEFFGHEPQADIELLERGFHVAYIDIQNLYGAPPAMLAMDAMYDRVTNEFHLSDKVVLEGFSRGGLYSLNWAARNPNRVACIYNDAPVCDFNSWPGGKGVGPGSPDDWQRCKSAYGFTNDEEALNSPLNPVNQLATLAAANIPLLHVCGAADEVVPMVENSLAVQRRYLELGGSFTLISKPHCKHHPHSLQDPTRIVNFVLSHTGFADQITTAATPFGYDYFQPRDGLLRCKAKFESAKTGRVAFLGGSITAAAGWRDQVCQDLQRRFPHTQFEFINAGIPSLGSTPGAFRLQRDVLSHGTIDLLFEEAAVNDDTNGFSDIEQIRGMEGIVRQALLANPSMDIVLLHFADPGKIEDYRQGKTPAVIANHERVAEQYRVASIDLAKEVSERISAGEFTWETDFVDLHPSPFGHALYANSISRLLDAAWSNQPSAEPSSVSADQRVHLPDPVDPFSYFKGRLVSPQDLAKTPSQYRLGAWQFVENWAPSDNTGTRPGFVNVPVMMADKAGATMSMKFTGNGIGVFVASGLDAGTLEFRIDNDSWQTCELFTQWSPSLHLPWAKMLASDLSSSEHQLELRVSESTDPRSTGHAVRIVYFLVNGP